MASNPENILPLKELSTQEQDTVFQHLFRRLAAFRNTHEVYARMEYELSDSGTDAREIRRDQVIKSLNHWSQELLEKAWVVCRPSEDEQIGQDHWYSI